MKQARYKEPFPPGGEGGPPRGSRGRGTGLAVLQRLHKQALYHQRHFCRLMEQNFLLMFLAEFL